MKQVIAFLDRHECHQPYSEPNILYDIIASNSGFSCLFSTNICVSFFFIHLKLKEYFRWNICTRWLYYLKLRLLVNCFNPEMFSINLMNVKLKPDQNKDNHKCDTFYSLQVTSWNLLIIPSDFW